MRACRAWRATYIHLAARHLGVATYVLRTEPPASVAAVTSRARGITHSGSSSPWAGYISTVYTIGEFLPVPLLKVPMRVQPIAHSAMLSSPMIGLLGDNRLAAGHDLIGLLWAAKHGQTASATGRSPRGQHGEQDCAMHGLVWTVLRYTRSLAITRQRLSCSDTFRSKKF